MVLGPWGVVQGPKRGQNGSFWGSQNDPSDRWFWPFSPPKPGQEGSQKGSKKGVKTTLLDPSGTPQTPDPVVGCGLLAISSVILAPRGPGGVIQGSKMTHFGVPLFDPFGRSGPEMTHFTGVIWTLLARGVQKGVQKGVILDPLNDPPGPLGAKMTEEMAKSRISAPLNGVWGVREGSKRGPK